LEEVALLAKTEGPYGTTCCSGQAHGGGQALIGIEVVLDDRLAEGSFGLFAGMTGGAVWEEGAAVAPDTAFHSRKTCWRCRVLVVCSMLFSKRTV